MFTKTLPLALLALSLTACADKPQQPQHGTLNRTVNMIGADGKLYGRVEFDPISGGTIYDTEGRIIGHIERPQQ